MDNTQEFQWSLIRGTAWMDIQTKKVFVKNISETGVQVIPIDGKGGTSHIAFRNFQEKLDFLDECKKRNIPIDDSELGVSSTIC